MSKKLTDKYVYVLKFQDGSYLGDFRGKTKEFSGALKYERLGEALGVQDVYHGELSLRRVKVSYKEEKVAIVAVVDE